MAISSLETVMKVLFKTQNHRWICHPCQLHYMCLQTVSTG